MGRADVRGRNDSAKLRTNMEYAKPLPSLHDPDALPYWQAARENMLSVQQCGACKRFVYPPGPSCSWCGADELAYSDLGSNIEGVLYSFTVVYRAFLPGFDKEVPYVVANVELCGTTSPLKILANLKNCAPDKVRIGMRVRMVWERCTDQITLPQWVPL